MKAEWKLVLALGIAFALGGCATMSGEECMATDWSAVGYEDGARGYTSDRFATHRKACAKHGVTADFGAYQSGREQGLREYCQPGRGFDVGASGGRYYGVCDVQLEGDFLDAYNAGAQLYSLRSNVNRANAEINARERELEELRDQMKQNELLLVDDETTMEQRIVLLADLKEMSERKGRLEAEIRDLYDARARHQSELEAYQVAVADFGY